MAEPVEVVLGYLELVRAGDPAAALVIADDVELTVRGSHPLAGRWHGRDQALAVIGRMGGGLRFVGIRELLGGPASVLAIVDGEATIASGVQPVRRLVLYGVDGPAIRSIDVFEDDQALVDLALAEVEAP